jgi:phage terminase Nu1 subunit (DNA packaging protein)
VFPPKWNLQQLAQLLQLDRRTIAEKLKMASVPFEAGTKNSKLYVLDDVLAVLYKDGSQNSNNQPMSDIDKEKLKLTTAKREQAEHDLAVSRRDVIPIAEVVSVVSREYTFVRSQLRGLPSRLAKHVANQSDPAVVFKMLSEAVDEVLTELQSDAETKLAEVPPTETQETTQDQTTQNQDTN